MRIESNLPSIEKQEQKDFQSPIVDIIRHGKSFYKEYLDKDYRFDQSSSDFALSEAKLDLTEKGIEEIEESAKQLTSIINKDKEIILLITSPSYRATSSLLVMKMFLERQGISILNLDNPHTSDQLRPLDLKDLDKDKDEFLAETVKYMKEEDNAKKPVDEIKEAIAERMNREFGDLYTEDSFDKVNERFKRFIRHMSNLSLYLKMQTKQLIGDKRIRLVCLTHEEVPVRFMKETFGEEAKLNLQNGQILEITSEIKNKNKIKLFPKNPGEEIREAEY